MQGKLKNIFSTCRRKPANSEVPPAAYNTVIVLGKAGRVSVSLSAPLPNILQLSFMTAMKDKINESSSIVGTNSA